MNNKSNIIAGLFIAIGLIILGCYINKGIKSFKMLDRSVVVKGLSEIEMPADRVIWPIPFNEVSNDMQTLYEEVKRKNQIIIDFLTSNGISKDEITLSNLSVEDRHADSYNSSSRYRYFVKSVVTVTSEKVDLVRELMPKQSELIHKGIAVGSNSWDNPIDFQFTKLNEIKPQMIEEATKNARASAVKFAEDSQSKLGKIKSAYQGQISIYSRDENTPYIKSLRVVTTVEYMLED